MRRIHVIMMVLALLLMAGMLWSGAKKPVESFAGESADALVSAEQGEPVAGEGLDSRLRGNDAAGESEALVSEEPGGSEHISPGLDNVVLVTIIPLIALIFGIFYKKNYDKDGFNQVLIQLWGIVKDVDNVFSKPGAEEKYKKLIDSEGINGAKKLVALAQAQQLIPKKGQSLAKKIAGGLDNALELAITAFKAGAIIVPAAKKIFK